MGARRLGRWENGSMKYYFTDHLGSTRIVMDSAGKCTYQDYDPFGGDFGATSSERYKFTGKEDDDATGLYYYNAWYYDPTVGRFISEDPAKDGINWYGYCENNSLKYSDRNGLAKTFTFYDPLFYRKVEKTISINVFVNRSIDKSEMSDLISYVNKEMTSKSSSLEDITGGVGTTINVLAFFKTFEKSTPALLVISTSLDALAWLNHQHEKNKQAAFDYEKGVMTDVKDQCQLGTISLFEINIKSVTSEKIDNGWVSIFTDYSTGYMVEYGDGKTGFIGIESFKELVEDTRRGIL